MILSFLNQHLAAAGAGSATTAVLFWVLLLIGVMIVAGVVIMFVRNRMRADDGPVATNVFAELESMLASGQISQEEYKAARKRLAERVSGKRVIDPSSVIIRNGELVARPGVDLTGRPLPRVGEGAAATETGPGEDTDRTQASPRGDDD